jgi:hypothetical protein
MRAVRAPSRRAVAIGAAVAVVAGGAVGGALAASGTFDPAKERQAFLDDAAGRLGVTSSKLEQALKGAAIDRVDAALAAGEITQAQADALKDAINAGKLPLGIRPFGGLGLPGGPHGGLHLYKSGDPLAAAATYLGLTEGQLRSQLAAGKSLADVAKAQGKSVAGLEQALLADVQSRLDQAVKDGRLTAAQRDQILARLKANIDAFVNRTPLAPPPPQGAFGDRFRLAPGGFERPTPADRLWAGPTA